MNAAEVIEVTREALLTIIIVSGPIMLIGLLVGLLVSLFQALTQLQEMTLVFVPKIIIVFASVVFFMPFMLRTMIAFTESLFDRIIGLS